MVTQKNVFYLASSVFRANFEFDCFWQSMHHCHIFAHLHIYFIQMKALYYKDLCTLHIFCTSFCLFILFIFFFLLFVTFSLVFYDSSCPQPPIK